MSNKLKSIILIFIITFSIQACNSKTERNKKESRIENTGRSTVVGNYVSDGYFSRNQGSDWISIIVTNSSEDKLDIKVRSRVDKKNPTCTFNGIAHKIDDENYQTQINDKTILFQFSSNYVSITTKNDIDKEILKFYCSGGASLQGKYKRLEEALDEKQIDSTQYSKIGSLQDVGFNVTSIKEKGGNQLKIFTYGLPNEYYKIFRIGNEIVTNVEIEDLNSDDSPELIVFTKSVDSIPRSNIYAFSVNNKKSMNQIYFMPIEENKEINNGYNGHDQFAIVETSLIQRFPIFENNIKTGKMRQIQYRLVNGEVSRKFEVKSQSEYDLK